MVDAMNRGADNFLKARQEAKKGELDEQLKEYINEWRKQRAKEEEELKRLKEKQAKRKEIRAEQEKKLAQQKKEEEERLRKEEAEKKAKEAEEKRKRLEEAEKKRQAMMQAQKEKQQASGQGAKVGGKKADSASVSDKETCRFGFPHVRLLYVLSLICHESKHMLRCKIQKRAIAENDQCQPASILLLISLTNTTTNRI